MPNHANITLVGHLGRDPETRPAGSTTVTGFSMAVKTGYGEREMSTWYNVSIFGKRGEAAATHLAKGDAVIVSGEPQLRKYVKADGSEGFSLDVNANSWGFAGSKSDKPQAAPKKATHKDDGFGDTEIPF